MEEEEEGWWGERLGKREGEEDKNRGRVSTKEGLRKRGRDRKTEKGEGGSDRERGGGDKNK